MKQITNANYGNVDAATTQYEKVGAAVKVICLNCSRNYLAEGGTPEYNRMVSGELLAVCPSCSAAESFVFIGGPDRIEVIALMKKREGRRTIGLYEIRIPGSDRHKFVLAHEIKAVTGVRQMNQYEVINGWLNTPSGALWIVSAKHITLEEFETIGAGSL